MTQPSELSKPDDSAVYRNKIRRQHDQKQQDRKMMRDILKVVLVLIVLITLAVISVSDGVLDNPASNHSSPLSW